MWFVCFSVIRKKVFFLQVLSKRRRQAYNKTHTTQRFKVDLNKAKVTREKNCFCLFGFVCFHSFGVFLYVWRRLLKWHFVLEHKGISNSPMFVMMLEHRGNSVYPRYILTGAL